jgi:acyl-CoA reductase-like NAD-dependent aldehyde dehydrogenase
MAEQQIQPVPLFINGESVQTNSVFPIVSPLDGATAWTASNASVADATKAVEAAQAAFPSWSRTKPSVRRDIFLKAAELFSARRQELFSYMKTETAPDDGFIWFNIETTINQLKDTAGRISGIQGAFPTIEGEGRSALVLQEPYGVVLGIAPW